MMSGRDQGFLESEQPRSDAAGSRFHVIPVPFEQSVSYGTGTRRGPEAIIEASQQLEAYDGFSFPLELGIHTTPAVDCAGPVETVLARIAEQCHNALKGGALPVVLGGEHTVTVGALEAATRFAGKPIGLVQIDAHADLRDTYEGNRYSHACVARRAHEDLRMPLFQLGVRALCAEEVSYRLDHRIAHVDAITLHRSGIESVKLPEDFPQTVYLTLDVDGLDPSVIRATGTPVPGGIGWYDALHVVDRVIAGRTVIGFDVVELAPVESDHASSYAAAQLVYAVMGMVQRNGR